MADTIDGIYSGLFSGRAGEGSAMFVLSGGKLTGADPLGVLFDGTYTPDGNGGFSGPVTVTVPANGELVQGVTSGPDGLVYQVDVSIPADFQSRPFLRLETPLGPVNFSLRFVRAVD